MAPVPRFERIAAGVLAGVYLVEWGLMWRHGSSPFDLFRYLYQLVVRLAEELSTNRGWTELAWENAFSGLTYGSALASLVLLVEAVLRAFGAAGLLPGRSMWWGQVVAGLSTITGCAGAAWWLSRRYVSIGYSTEQLRIAAGFTVPMLLSAYVLYRTRPSAANHATP
jgi:hypothetical protein